MTQSDHWAELINRGLAENQATAVKIEIRVQLARISKIRAVLASANPTGDSVLEALAIVTKELIGQRPCTPEEVSRAAARVRPVKSVREFAAQLTKHRKIIYEALTAIVRAPIEHPAASRRTGSRSR